MTGDVSGRIEHADALGWPAELAELGEVPDFPPWEAS
jgi:hypothetical protein